MAVIEATLPRARALPASTSRKAFSGWITTVDREKIAVI
jgi:hypothetical protein